jgi:hypothetical protein
MTFQVIVPHRPGPLVDVPDIDGNGPGPGPGEPPAGLIGAPELLLSGGGAVLLAAVLFLGLPGWLSVVAVACLALGLALPAHAALLLAMRRHTEHRRRSALALGTMLDASDPSVRRLVTAYGRLERTAGPGPARDAGHLALLEVAGTLAGRTPEGDEKEYVARRADAVSTLADRLADGPIKPSEPAGTDSIARIHALLT